MLDGVSLDQLRAFIAAVDEGSFSAAGRNLRRAQSVVSQTILRILPRSGIITRGEILFADPRLDGKVVDIAKLPSVWASAKARSKSISCGRSAI